MAGLRHAIVRGVNSCSAAIRFQSDSIPMPGVSGAIA